jgi:hypothetical protein
MIDVKLNINSAQYAFLKMNQKKIRKSNRKFIQKMEKITREYEKSVDHYLKEISNFSKLLPNYWGLSICSFKPIYCTLHNTDMKQLSHITDIICHRRSNLYDGFLLTFRLDEEFGNYSVVRSFTLSPSLRKNIEDDVFSYTNSSTVTHINYHLVAVGLLTPPSTSTNTSVKSTFQNKIKKVNFFSFLLNDLNLALAELIVREYLPYSFVYYLKALLKNTRIKEGKEMFENDSEKSESDD